MSDNVDFEEIAAEYNLEVQEVILNIIKVRDTIEAPTFLTRKPQAVALASPYLASNGYLQNNYRNDPDWVQPSGDPTSANKKAKKIPLDPPIPLPTARLPARKASTIAPASGILTVLRVSCSSHIAIGY